MRSQAGGGRRLGCARGMGKCVCVAGGGILGSPFPLCSYAEQYFGPGTRLTVLGKKLLQVGGRVDSHLDDPLNTGPQGVGAGPSKGPKSRKVGFAPGSPGLCEHRPAVLWERFQADRAG